MQEGTKGWEQRRRRKSSCHSLSDISTDGSPYWSEADGSDNESAHRPRSRSGLFPANQPKSRFNRSMSRDAGMDRSDDFESIAHGLSYLQSELSAAKSDESFGPSSSNEQTQNEKNSIFWQMSYNLFGAAITNKITQVSNQIVHH